MFVSDELMGKLLKSTNITTEDVEEDEINERSIRIVKRAEALKKAGKWEDADRSGVEYYFLKSFMTNDLYKDFPVIINHFLKHCSDKVQKYMAAWWHGGMALMSLTFTRWMRRSSIRCSVQYTMVQSLGMTTAGS